jgi:hypothetical protein
MKADTFAKLVVVETLIDAEIGHYLEFRPPSMDRFKEVMVARISDLVDEIDALDAVAAARVYDAIVDFLAELPEDDEGVVGATVRFKRALDRLVERGTSHADLGASSTWAVVLDELLEVLADEYHGAVSPGGEVMPREYLRSRFLLDRARSAADRVMQAERPERRAELRSAMDRLAFAVNHRRLRPAAVDLLIAGPQRIARRHRPSSLTRVGSFVIRQLLRRREPRGRRGDRGKGRQ